MSIKVRCDQCRLALHGKKAGNQHAEETGHVWKPGYYCTVCGATWKKCKDSKGHMKAYHSDPKGAPLTSVPAVAKPYHATSSSPPQAQTQTSSLSTVTAASVGTYNIWGHGIRLTCPKCLEQFRDGYALQTHRQAGCAAVPPAHDANQDEAASKDHQPEIVQETCHICDTVFPDKDALQNHVASSFTCKKCAVHHASEQELQEHYQRESKLHPRCKACGLAFQDMPAWAHHKAQCPPAVPAVDKGSPMSCDDSVHDDVSKTAASSQGVTETEAQAYPEPEHTSDGDPQPKQSLNEDDFGAASDGESDRVRERSGHASTSFVSAPAFEPSNDEPAPVPDQAEIVPTLLRFVLDEQVLPDDAAHPDARIPTGPVTGLSEAAKNPTELRAMRSVSQGDYATNRPEGSSTKDPVLSYHCRACLNNPCVEPVVTFCGHLFCRGCLLQEMMSRASCPVCGKIFFVKLHVQL